MWHNAWVTNGKELLVIGARDKPIKPLVRWIGGKSTLVRSLIKLMPTRFERFFEPMAGSAALFFGVLPEHPILGDSNGELINYYQVMSSDADRLIPQLMSLQASKDQYYKFRSASPRGDTERAIRFAYLSRLSWNAVYRVNKNGRFNVPIGDRLPESLWDQGHLRECADLLKRAELIHGDFEETAQRAKRGDLVYFDPPYPKHRTMTTSFNRYASSPFKTLELTRLISTVEDLNERGVKLMISSSVDDPFLAAYPNFLIRHPINSRSLISAKTNSRRRGITELVLLNYEEGCCAT